MDLTNLKKRTRSDYPHRSEYRTRWSDNDMYAHMNNSQYYFLMDSITNAYLITHCSFSPSTSSQIGLVVHSHCDYFAPVGFPAVLDLGLRVNSLGRSSVRYEIGVFEQGSEDVKAVGEFVHVFVEREGRRPVAGGMLGGLREGLEKLVVEYGGEEKRKKKIVGVSKL